MATATANKPATKTAKPAKVLHESRVENPVARVHAFVIKNHKKLGRAECIRQLEKMGIAHWTARTQYQVVHARGYKAKAAK